MLTTARPKGTCKHSPEYESRRIQLPRTRVNKGRSKGRDCTQPRPFVLRANYFASSYGPTRLAVPCSSNPDVTCWSVGLTWTNENILPSGAMNKSSASFGP
jgi:hypothetical protein